MMMNVGTSGYTLAVEKSSPRTSGGRTIGPVGPVVDSAVVVNEGLPGRLTMCSSFVPLSDMSLYALMEY